MATSAKSRSFNKMVSGPLSADALSHAESIARRYRVVLEQQEDGTWIGHGLEMPTVFGDGETPDAAVRDTREALVIQVGWMLHKGRKPPRPAGKAVRDIQVNVRLSREEKLRLESQAKEGGFRGVSDFIRTKALGGEPAEPCRQEHRSFACKARRVSPGRPR